MNDWTKVKEKNKERLERLNLPDFKSDGKVFIFDKYCPYSLNVIDIEPAFESVKFGIHGTWAGQTIKVVAGDTVKFYGSGFTSDFNKIVDYCISNDIRVINSSIVCSYSKEREAAIRRYAEWGGVWISSAGNDNHKEVHFPGSSKYTIGVSATNSEDCNGPEIDVTTDSYWYVRNKNEGYFTSFNGTSCAAPVIAGVVRLILDVKSEWKLEKVRNFLKENSTTEMKSLEKYERFFSFPDNFHKEVITMDYFKDDNGHWSEKFNNYLAEKGIVNGYADGTIRAEDNIKRGENNKLISAAIEFTLAEVDKKLKEALDNIKKS